MLFKLVVMDLLLVFGLLRTEETFKIAKKTKVIWWGEKKMPPLLTDGMNVCFQHLVSLFARQREVCGLGAPLWPLPWENR